MGAQKPALLPNPDVIADLIRSGMTPETIVLVINEDKKRNHIYALVSSIMGGICFWPLCRVLPTWLCMASTNRQRDYSQRGSRHH